MRLPRLCQLLSAAELVLVIGLAPALLFPTRARLLLLAIVPAVWACARMATGRFVPPTPINASLGLMLLTVGASTWATFDIDFSLGKVSGLLLGVLLFWAVTRWLTTLGRLRIAVAGYVLAGASLALIGLLGTGGSEKVPFLREVARHLPILIRGVPGAEDGFNPNAVAGSLVLFVPLQVVLVFAGARGVLFPTSSRLAGRVVAFILAGVLALSSATVVLMQSRGAWLGLVASAVICMGARGQLNRKLLVGAIGVALILATTLRPESTPGPVRTQVETALGGSPALRLELWASAIDAVRDAPITGVGMNAFRALMPVRYPVLAGLPDRDIAHSHNHLLQAALDLGIPGLVSYASIWLVAGALVIAVCRRSMEKVHRSVACGLGAGLIAHFVFGMTDAIPLGAKVGVLFWYALALVVGLHRTAFSGTARNAGSLTAPQDHDTSAR